MTQSEFIKGYCERSHITEEALDNRGICAVPCDCGEEVCPGWAMIHRSAIHSHVALYMKKGEVEEITL